jgi:hypothetical protein
MLRSKLGASLLLTLLAISVAAIVLTVILRERTFAEARAHAADKVASMNTGSDLLIGGYRVVRITFEAPTTSPVGDYQLIKISTKRLTGASIRGFDNLGDGFLAAKLTAPGFAITPQQDDPQSSASDQLSWAWQIYPSDIGQSLESHQFITAELFFSRTLPQPGSQSRRVYYDVVATRVTRPWYSQMLIIAPIFTGVLSLLGLVVSLIGRSQVKGSSTP